MKKQTIILTVLVLLTWYLLDRHQINTLSSLGKWVFIPLTSMGVGALCFSFMSIFERSWKLRDQIIFVALIQLWGMALFYFAIPWGEAALFTASAHTGAYAVNKLIQKLNAVKTKKLAEE